MTTFDWWFMLGIIPTGTTIAYIIVVFIAKLIWGGNHDTRDTDTYFRN